MHVVTHSDVLLLGCGVQVEGVQPLASPEDCFDAEAIAKANPEVVSLLKERYGISDLDLVACDPWSVHCAPKEGRLIQLFTYLRSRCAGVFLICIFLCLHKHVRALDVLLVKLPIP